MTGIVETLLLARKHGVRLLVDGDELVIESEERPPSELLAALRENKAALLEKLLQPPADEIDPDHWPYRVVWAREFGWVRIEDPFTGEWHEVRKDDALPLWKRLAAGHAACKKSTR
jgi:hypothetical protein